MGFIYIILNIHVSGISASVILTETQSTWSWNVILNI